MHTSIGSLPKHQYVFVDTKFTLRRSEGFMPAVWFGLVSHPGRVWGCNLLLENGAIYRNVPLHALAHTEPKKCDRDWPAGKAQHWDCYGYGWTASEYTYLKGVSCMAQCLADEIFGTYLFTVAPIGDGFSEVPEQAKEFTFVKLRNNRFTVQPTDRILFSDTSFTNHDWSWPRNFKRQTETYSCE